MARQAKKKQSYDGCTIDHFNPVRAEGWPKAINQCCRPALDAAIDRIVWPFDKLTVRPFSVAHDEQLVGLDRVGSVPAQQAIRHRSPKEV